MRSGHELISLLGWWASQLTAHASLSHVYRWKQFNYLQYWLSLWWLLSVILFWERYKILSDSLQQYLIIIHTSVEIFWCACVQWQLGTYFQWMSSPQFNLMFTYTSHIEIAGVHSENGLIAILLNKTKFSDKVWPFSSILHATTPIFLHINHMFF